MSVIDLEHYVAGLKDHLAGHGFHYHGERHFIETNSLLQTWEIDLHPDDACGGPLEVRLTVTADPRTILSFNEVAMSLPEDELPPDEYWAPLEFSYKLPPLNNPPDLLTLTTELAPLGGTELPVSVSAIDSLPSATENSQRQLDLVARTELSLRSLLVNEDDEENNYGMCDVLDRCHKISKFLLERSDDWLIDTETDPSEADASSTD